MLRIAAVVSFLLIGRASAAEQAPALDSEQALNATADEIAADPRLAPPGTLGKIYETLAARKWQLAGGAQGKQVLAGRAKGKKRSTLSAAELKNVSMAVKKSRSSKRQKSRAMKPSKKLSGYKAKIRALNAQLEDPNLTAAQASDINAEIATTYEDMAAAVQAPPVAVVACSVLAADCPDGAAASADTMVDTEPSGKAARKAGKASKAAAWQKTAKAIKARPAAGPRRGKYSHHEDGHHDEPQALSHEDLNVQNLIPFVQRVESLSDADYAVWAQQHGSDLPGFMATRATARHYLYLTCALFDYKRSGYAGDCADSEAIKNRLVPLMAAGPGDANIEWGQWTLDLVRGTANAQPKAKRAKKYGDMSDPIQPVISRRDALTGQINDPALTPEDEIMPGLYCSRAQAFEQLASLVPADAAASAGGAQKMRKSAKRPAASAKPRGNYSDAVPSDDSAVPEAEPETAGEAAPDAEMPEDASEPQPPTPDEIRKADESELHDLEDQSKQKVEAERQRQLQQRQGGK